MLASGILTFPVHADLLFIQTQFVYTSLFFVCVCWLWYGITDALEDQESTVSIGGRTITNLRYADDISGLAGEEEELTNLVERLDNGHS